MELSKCGSSTWGHLWGDPCTKERAQTTPIFSLCREAPDTEVPKAHDRAADRPQHGLPLVPVSGGFVLIDAVVMGAPTGGAAP